MGPRKPAIRTIDLRGDLVVVMVVEHAIAHRVRIHAGLRAPRGALVSTHGEGEGLNGIATADGEALVLALERITRPLAGHGRQQRAARAATHLDFFQGLHLFYFGRNG